MSEMNLFKMQDEVMKFMKENWDKMSDKDKMLLNHLHHEIRNVDCQLKIEHL